MARRPLSQFGLTLPVALAVVSALGLVRLGRQFPAAASSPGLLVPFLLPVLALALEAAAFVALSAAALGALTAQPLRAGAWSARGRATAPLLLLLGGVLGAAELIPRGTEHPGAFANQLIETARASCGASSGSVPIPLLGLSIRCDAAQRIEGPMPGVRGTSVSMRELRFADDLRRVEIVGLDLTAARSLRVQLHAGSASVKGLAPWSRSPRLGALVRFGVLLGLGVGLWLAANLGFRVPQVEATSDGAPSPLPQQLLLRGLHAAPGAVLAAAFIVLDQDRAEPATYLGALLAALLALGAVTLALRRAPRLFSSFPGF